MKILKKNNNCFFPTVKQHCTDNIIQELEFDNGRITQTKLQIFYKNRRNFMKTFIPLNLNWVTRYDPQYELEFFTKFDDILRILEEDEGKLRKPITQEEMLTAIKQMQNEKSPGLYEVPAELFNFFWQDIKKNLLNSYITSLDKSILVYFNAGGLVALIHIVAKNVNILNWRPILLMNVGFNILTRLLPTRFKGVLHTIIHADQKDLCLIGNKRKT